MKNPKIFVWSCMLYAILILMRNANESRFSFPSISQSHRLYSTLCFHLFRSYFLTFFFLSLLKSRRYESHWTKQDVHYWMMMLLLLLLPLLLSRALSYPLYTRATYIVLHIRHIHICIYISSYYPQKESKHTHLLILYIKASKGKQNK